MNRCARRFLAGNSLESTRQPWTSSSVIYSSVFATKIAVTGPRIVGVRSARKFAPVASFHPRDLAYVSDRIAAAQETIDLTDYPRQTMARHQAAILEFYGFRAFKPHGRALLAAEIARLVQSHLKPQLIFSRAVEVPGYFPLAALILSAINPHYRRLIAAIEALLTPETRGLLDALLLQEATEDGSPPGKTVAYKLTSMKKLSQSTKPSMVKERVADLKLVHESFQLLKPVLDHLNLGPEGIQYYAYGVIKAEIFQLTRRGAYERYLHLTTFIAHQYYRLHDNLVDVLLSSLQFFQNSGYCAHRYRESATHPRETSLISLALAPIVWSISTLVPNIRGRKHRGFWN